MKVSRASNSLGVEIQKPVLEDEGEYLCEASNKLGNSSASASFNAKGKYGVARDCGNWNLSPGYPCFEQIDQAK